MLVTTQSAIKTPKIAYRFNLAQGQLESSGTVVGEAHPVFSTAIVFFNLWRAYGDPTAWN
jgi:hypothetical protein